MDFSLGGGNLLQTPEGMMEGWNNGIMGIKNGRLSDLYF
ncbi:hypothetical protein D1AOALGA4SA_3066 [Olavius algarvensis Delta 1 endosymbiont]|nr:hypothetical protein D1AOALGA4SA_3066 [Olavius algarvensis Delta 1 endosymbiont]